MNVDSVRQAFQVLDLSSDASLKEVRTAYRALVRSWHPDRFAHDPRLQQKAQERLKQINAAYNIARKNIRPPSTEIDSPFRFKPATVPSAVAATADTAGAPSTVNDRPKKSLHRPPPAIERPVVLNAMFLFLFIAVIWSTWRKYDVSSQGLSHILLILTIPTLCALLSNSPFRTRQLRGGYLAAIMLAAVISLFDYPRLTEPSDVAHPVQVEGDSFPYSGRAPSEVSGFRGEFGLGPTDRHFESGPQTPMAPVAPSAPLAPAPAPPSSPQAPLQR